MQGGARPSLPGSLLPGKNQPGLKVSCLQMVQLKPNPLLFDASPPVKPAQSATSSGIRCLHTSPTRWPSLHQGASPLQCVFPDPDSTYKPCQPHSRNIALNILNGPRCGWNQGPGICGEFQLQPDLQTLLCGIDFSGSSGIGLRRQSNQRNESGRLTWL